MLTSFIDNLSNGRASFSNTRLTLFTGLAYILLGGVGLLLAIGPGYASPIFPASGLALALVLLFGARALPGVWLGSAVVNMVIALLHGTLNPASTAVALLIACGATAQAWLGFWLVNRRLSSVWHNLERELDALIFLLLGGGVACLLSASVGVSGLYAAGIINHTDIFYSWWNWYVGDTLGVLIFAPLLLRLFNRTADQSPNQFRYMLFPILLMLILLWLAFYGTTYKIRKDQESRLKNDCEAVAKRISDRLLTHREVLMSLHNFIEATPNFSFKQFERFTRITLKDNSDIFALSFNDLVENGQRPGYERKMSDLSPLGRFQITERDSGKRLIPANKRAEYVSVRYIVPLVGNTPAIGFDINSEPIRRDAINRARASKNMVVTSPIQLVQEKKKRVGVLELMPVEEISATVGSDLKNPHLLGFAVSVVKVDEMIEIATRGSVPRGLLFQVTDRNAAKGKDLLYRSDADTARKIPLNRAGDWKTGLHMGDRNWEFSAYVTDEYLQQQRPFMAWGMGLITIVITGLMQLLIIGMAGRTTEIQRTTNAVNAYLDNLFNFANVPIIVWDGNFKITRFSKAFEILTGRSADEVVTKDITAIFPLDDAEHSLELIHTCQDIGYPCLRANSVTTWVTRLSDYV